MGNEWAERARSFGQDAHEYERHRPGCPDALYCAVLALTPGGSPCVLEVGAGTGRALAERGAGVVAVEPDRDMAAIARRRTAGLAVRVEERRCEVHRPDPGSFDLVVAAQAWHWVDRETGSVVARRALHAHGALAP